MASRDMEERKATFVPQYVSRDINSLYDFVEEHVVPKKDYVPIWDNSSGLAAVLGFVDTLSVCPYVGVVTPPPGFLAENPKKHRCTRGTCT